jgi:hypothetical protein
MMEESIAKIDDPAKWGEISGSLYREKKESFLFEPHKPTYNRAVFNLAR